MLTAHPARAARCGPHPIQVTVTSSAHRLTWLANRCIRARRCSGPREPEPRRSPGTPPFTKQRLPPLLVAPRDGRKALLIKSAGSVRDRLTWSVCRCEAGPQTGRDAVTAAVRWSWEALTASTSKSVDGVSTSGSDWWSWFIRRHVERTSGCRLSS
jgi:hypothetical protein